MTDRYLSLGTRVRITDPAFVDHVGKTGTVLREAAHYDAMIELDDQASTIIFLDAHEVEVIA